LPQGTRVKLRKEEKLTIMSFLRKEKNEKNVGGTKLGITVLTGGHFERKTFFNFCPFGHSEIGYKGQFSYTF